MPCKLHDEQRRLINMYTHRTMRKCRLIIVFVVRARKIVRFLVACLKWISYFLGWSMGLVRQLITILMVPLLTTYYFSTGPLKRSSTQFESIHEEYDYIIVGGGTAGSVLAARLTENKSNMVLLVEAGGHFDENPLFSVPSKTFALQNSDYDWAYYTVPQKFSHFGAKEKRGFWPRGRVLGGTSMINLLLHVRGSKYDFEEWATNGCSGWSYKDVLPYFLKSEDVQIEDLKSSKYHATGGPIAVRDGDVTPLADFYMKAGEELGYNTTDYNGEDQHGFGRFQVNIRNGVKSNTAFEFLPKNAERKNLHVALRSFVSNVKIENNKATGVFVIKNGRKIYIKAKKEVIISAGAINSPQILMLSGIGPKKHLKETGIKLEKDLPVGQNLQDHMVVFMFSKINSSIGLTGEILERFWTRLQYSLFRKGPLSVVGVEGTAFMYTDGLRKRTTYDDIQIAFLSMLLPYSTINYRHEVAKEYFFEGTNIHGFTSAVFNTHPKSRGEIKLRSRDPFDYPYIDPMYLSDSRDVKELIAGIKIWEKFIETPTMQSLNARVDEMKLSFCSQHEFRSRAYWECFIQHMAVTAHHSCCTVKMGAESDPSAVVDPQLRVRGISGLRVVDASVFPNITSGNIAAPIIMIAEKIADIIRGIDSVKEIRDRLSNI